MSNPKATWDVSLDTTCPTCNHWIDLFAETWVSDLISDRALQVGENGTPETTDVEVQCPRCQQDFHVDFDY